MKSELRTVLQLLVLLRLRSQDFVPAPLLRQYVDSLGKSSGPRFYQFMDRLFKEGLIERSSRQIELEWGTNVRRTFYRLTKRGSDEAARLVELIQAAVQER